MIGPAGGTLTGPDGVQVVVPPGALDQPTTIGIARNAAGAPAALDAYPAADNVYELTPHDLPFNLPVTIRVPVSGSASGTLFMASSGQDWSVTGATVVNGMAEGERGSFSWVYWSSYPALLGTVCSIPVSMLHDPYWCAVPSIGASVSSTPPQALTQTPFSPYVYYGRVDQAATLHFQSQFYVPGNCVNAVTVELSRRRFNVSTLRWGPPQTILTQSPALTVDGSRLSGTATFDVPFTHLDNGKSWFKLWLSTDCPGVLRSANGGFLGWDYGNYRSRGAFVQMYVEGNIAPSTVFYTVGGTVTGLTGTGLVLQNNGGDDLAVTADGPFSFATAIASGLSYSVSVQTQPSGQFCTVQNGSGTAQANVSNVAVSCSADFYTIGGTVTGLTGTGLVLQNNGGDNLAVAADGSFTFATAIASGLSYSVSVQTQPAGQTCIVQNGSGTAQANVTNVAVNCGAQVLALSPVTVSARGCSVDTVTFTASGGTPPYTWSSSEGGSTNLGVINATQASWKDGSDNFCGSGGTVTITVTDSAGANASSTITVLF